ATVTGAIAIIIRGVMQRLRSISDKMTHQTQAYHHLIGGLIIMKTGVGRFFKVFVSWVLLKLLIEAQKAAIELIGTPPHGTKFRGDIVNHRLFFELIGFASVSFYNGGEICGDFIYLKSRNFNIDKMSGIAKLRIFGWERSPVDIWHIAQVTH